MATGGLNWNDWRAHPCCYEEYVHPLISLTMYCSRMVQQFRWVRSNLSDSFSRVAVEGSNPYSDHTLSAGAMKGDKEKGLEIGMTDYLTKPVNYAELIKAMTNT